jgi:hypothetical protein
MKFTRGQMLELTFLTSCYSSIVVTAWLRAIPSRIVHLSAMWPLIASSAFICVSMLSFSLLGSFDAPTVAASLRSERCPSICAQKGQTGLFDGQGDDDEVDDSVEYEIR